MFYIKQSKQNRIKAFLFMLFFITCEKAFSQEFTVEYSKPLKYEKIDKALMVDALINYSSDKKGVSFELDGISLAYTVLANGKFSLKLPLIGNKSNLVLKRNNKQVSSQVFQPIIPLDWGYFKNGTIHIISSSHQDIAWMNTPDSCREERIDKIILPAMDMMEKNPDFKFGMEQSLNLMEVMDKYPSYKDRAIKTFKSGQFGWGATFNQPYEGLESSEQLVRQLYLGKKWLQDNFDGQIDAQTAFNVDVPARTLQFPQILSSAGVRNLFISRFKEGFYNWYSPDGSKVFTYSPGNYGWAVMFYKYFDEDAPTAMNKLNGVLKNWDDYYAKRNIPPDYGVVISNDAAGPSFYKEVLHEWNNIVEVSGLAIPKLQYSTADSFLSKVNVPEARFDSIGGERPNLWLYIHGSSHYEAIKAKRKSAIHLPAAEMFNTINGLLTNDFSAYPKKQLDSAWYKSIYPDHGWGGKNGEVTDSIFRAYLEQGNAIATKYLYTALNSIGSKIKTSRKQAVVVYNDLAWNREGVVSVPFIGNKSAYDVIDDKGINYKAQVVTSEGSSSLVFKTGKVPSVGYHTYYIKPSVKPSVTNHTVQSNYYENEFYKVTLGNGGIKNLFDKNLQREILNTTRYSGADVLDMGYNGLDAGEFTQLATTNMVKFDKLSNHKAIWTIKNDGNVFTTYQAAYVMNGVDFIQRITIYHEIKKIEVEYELPDWKGVKSRQLSFAIPLNTDTASITYDVPMGVATAKKSELKVRPGGWAWDGTYWQKPEEIHPREFQNFVSANAAQFGLTMSTDIAMFDWVDPTTDAVSYPVLQGVMLTTQKSCHYQGPWYLQKGKHVFKFIITSHLSGWKNGYSFGMEGNHPFYTTQQTQINKNGVLPASYSFLGSSSPFINLTAFKKSDEENSVILRFVEMEGSDKDVSLKLFKDYNKLQQVSLIEKAPVDLPGQEKQIVLPIKKNVIKTLKIGFNK